MAETAALLPVEIEAAVKLAHRSPTYFVALPDGRTLRLRREAAAWRRNGSRDTHALAAGKGKVSWRAHCGDTEAVGETLGGSLIHALGIPTGDAEKELTFDAWWEGIALLVHVALSVAEAAVPNERQQAYFGADAEGGGHGD